MKETYQPGSLAPLIPENSVPARRKTGLLIAVGIGCDRAGLPGFGGSAAGVPQARSSSGESVAPARLH